MVNFEQKKINKMETKIFNKLTEADQIATIRLNCQNVIVFGQKIELILQDYFTDCNPDKLKDILLLTNNINNCNRNVSKLMHHFQIKKNRENAGK